VSTKDSHRIVILEDIKDIWISAAEYPDHTRLDFYYRPWLRGRPGYDLQIMTVSDQQTHTTAVVVWYDHESANVQARFTVAALHYQEVCTYMGLAGRHRYVAQMDDDEWHAPLGSTVDVLNAARRIP